MKINHPGQQSNKGIIQCQEENCTYSCGYLNELRKHLSVSHSIPIESEHMTFRTIEGTHAPNIHMYMHVYSYIRDHTLTTQYLFHADFKI